MSEINNVGIKKVLDRAVKEKKKKIKQLKSKEAVFVVGEIMIHNAIEISIAPPKRYGKAFVRNINVVFKPDKKKSEKEAFRLTCISANEKDLKVEMLGE